jgi:NMD protein affecting ribosome stability and mRNA decay
MSVSFTCDGCKHIVDEPKSLGISIKRDYCPECFRKASDFLETQEQLRIELYNEFTYSRESLIAKFSEDNFLLPDVK